MILGVFGRGRMGSIRRTLMAWLLLTFLAVALVHTGVSYRMFTQMGAAFLDEQMVQFGDAFAQQEQLVMPTPQSTARVLERGLYVIQVFDAGGRLVAASWPGVAARRMPSPGLHDIEDGGHPWRVYAATAAGGRMVQVLQSGDFRARLVIERAGSAAWPLLVLLPLSMAVLWAVARAISQALREIGNQAARQDAQSIAELPLERVPDEIRPLVASINGLLARLRSSFSAQRRFVQDAAHELRTPITAVGLQLENLRGDLAGNAAAAQHFQQLEAGVQRAQRLVDQLLRMSRQEAAPAETGGSVDLQEQLRESIRTLITLADQRRIDLGLVAAEDTAGIRLSCAAGDLRSALDNLIENALRYTPEGGTVDVRLLRTHGRTTVEVVDTGPGIAPEWLPRVFDRFFRVPGSAAGGSGLGLSIAQSAAQRCGLRLTLHNREDQCGLVARLQAEA